MREPGELRRALVAGRPVFARAALFGIAAAVLLLAPSWYMLEVYGRVVSSRSTATLAALSLALAAALAAMAVLDWCAGILLHHAGCRWEQRLAARAFDLSFATTRPARGVQPLDDLRLLREFAAGPAVRALFELPLAFLLLLVLALIHPLLAAVTLVAGAFQASCAWANERTTAQPLLRAAAAGRSAQEQAEAVLRHAEPIAALGMVAALQRRWMLHQAAFLSFQAGASIAAGTWQACTRLLQILLGSALLGLAAWLMLEGALDAHAGWLVFASILGARVLAPLGTLVAHWRSVVAARDAWQRLDGVLAAAPASAAGLALPRPAGRLAAEQLLVGAPGNVTPVLRNVSFALAPGEVLAVVGPSGSGKSTLARALVGLWPSSGGKVRLDGADVFAWDRAQLAPCLGYLPQEVELLEGSVAENIGRFGAGEREPVEAAARCVGLHDWVLQLPQGYATQVGPAGAHLSGGQRQRIALARALFGQPALVVLDEPDAHLDEAGEAALVAAIGSASARGTTFVVVTHRSSVLAQCDKLLVLADGQVQAFGPRADVLAALSRVQGAGTARQREAPAPEHAE